MNSDTEIYYLIRVLHLLRWLSSQIERLLKRIFGESENGREGTSHTTASLSWRRRLWLCFFRSVSCMFAHSHSLQYHVGIQRHNNSLIEQFITSKHKGIQIVINGLAWPWFFASLLKHFSKSINEVLHDVVIFFLIAKQENHELVDHFDQNSQICEGEDLIWMEKLLLS